jgi:hypothetical protein
VQTPKATTQQGQPSSPSADSLPSVDHEDAGSRQFGLPDFQKPPMSFATDDILNVLHDYSKNVMPYDAERDSQTYSLIKINHLSTVFDYAVRSKTNFLSMIIGSLLTDLYGMSQTDGNITIPYTFENPSATDGVIIAIKKQYVAKLLELNGSIILNSKDPSFGFDIASDASISLCIERSKGEESSTPKGLTFAVVIADQELTDLVDEILGVDD